MFVHFLARARYYFPGTRESPNVDFTAIFY